MISAPYFPAFFCSMFHIGKKGKTLNFFFIDFGQCLSLSTQLKKNRMLYTCYFSYFFVLCSIKINFPFLNQWWMVGLLDLLCNICTKYGDHFLFFYHWILDWYRMNNNLNFIISSSVYLKWNYFWYNIALICLDLLLLLHQLCIFTWYGSIFKLFSSQSKILNPLLKQYSKILWGNLSITTYSLFFNNPWQDKKFNNISGILNPNTLS